MTAKLDALAGQMSSGAISPIEFYQQAFSVIEFGNARAAVLGSFRAKRHNPPSDIAIRVAARASEEQRGFLLRFARDLAEGKYRPKSQGGKGARQRLARFALYSARLAGTANESWLQTTIAQAIHVYAWTGKNPVFSIVWLLCENAVRSAVLCSELGEITWLISTKNL
jgi:hypothetical protein